MTFERFESFILFNFCEEKKLKEVQNILELGLISKSSVSEKKSPKKLKTNKTLKTFKMKC